MKTIFFRIKVQEIALFYAGWIFAMLSGLLSIAGVVNTFGLRPELANLSIFSISIFLFFWTIAAFLSLLKAGSLRNLIRWLVLTTLSIQMILVIVNRFLYPIPEILTWTNWLTYMNAAAVFVLGIWFLTKKPEKMSLNLQTAAIIAFLIFAIGSIFSGPLINHITFDFAFGLPELLIFHSIQLLPLFAIFYERKFESYAIAFTVVTSIFYLIYISYGMMSLGSGSSWGY